MKFLLALCVVGCFTSTRADGTSAVRSLLGRVLPSPAVVAQFNLRLAPGTNYFAVSAASGVVTVEGSDGVALASGVYYYLKNACGAIVRWGENGTGVQMNLPAVLPDYPFTNVSSPYSIRYSWNVCTFGYTAFAWGWDRWEFEIDWLALHGINTPLAFVGQEYVWKQMFLKLGFKPSDLDSFFSGPAFLPWQRMGNMRGFGGPLSDAWLEGQMELQLRILARMRALGMRPVLPCFSGFVPNAITTLYPQAKTRQSADWNGFSSGYCCNLLLDPTDSVYTNFSRTFMETLIDTYGATGFYNCDTFNEMDPSTDDPTYLKEAALAVVSGIQTVDTSGIWVMQGWLFHSSFWSYANTQAYLSSIPVESLVILDLNSEDGPLAWQYDNYFGKKWVWNMLQNYGGRRALYGNIPQMYNAPVQDLTRAGKGMVGLGFTPEAIEQNPVMFELLTDMGWRGVPMDDGWLARYVNQSYNVRTGPLFEAWVDNLLVAGYSGWGMEYSGMVNTPNTRSASHAHSRKLRDGIHKIKPRLDSFPIKSYWEAWRLFTEHATTMGSTATGNFNYDYVDLTRQCLDITFHIALQAFGGEYLNSVTGQKGAGGVPALQALRGALLQLAADLDRALLTSPSFLTSLWVWRGFKMGSTPAESALFAYNAKNQITLWGPRGEIDNYAAKAWQGVVKDLYYPRWALWGSYYINSVSTGQPVDGNAMAEEMFNITQSWDNSGIDGPIIPAGNISEIGPELYTSYSAALDAFVVTADTDAVDQDIVEVSVNYGAAPVAWVCLQDPNCMGFNKNGFLKYSLNLGPSAGNVLYIKKDARRS